MKKRIKIRDKTSEAVTAYAMLLPNILGLSVFVFIPILYALFVSLHNWNGLTAMKYNGLQNYIKLVKDEVFWQSVWITIKYTLIYVPAIFVISLMLALIVNSIKGSLQAVFRTLYFIPYSISIVVASLMWIFMLDPMRGYINSFLSILGIQKQNFLGSTEQALFSVAIVGIWLAIGYNMLLFIAALKDVPKEYYEAADIDGAGSLRKFFHVSFPMLQNTNIFILIVTTIGSFQVFDQIKVMTNGGPASATNVTVYYIYQNAFEITKIGYSSAISFVLFIIIMLLTLFQLKVFSGKEV